MERPRVVEDRSPPRTRCTMSGGTRRRNVVRSSKREYVDGGEEVVQIEAEDPVEGQRSGGYR
jgi:hypothetical protein